MAPVPDAARIAHKLVVGPEVMYVTHAVVYHSEATAASLNEIAESAAESWNDNIQPFICQSIVWEECTATDLGDPTRPVAVSTHAPQAGGDVATPMPMQVAFVATLRTAKRGRSYTGRMYIPGLSTARGGGGGQGWSSGTVSSMQSRLDAYKEGIDPDVGDNGAMVVASQKLGTFEDVTDIVARPYFGTQRRRLNSTF